MRSFLRLGSDHQLNHDTTFLTLGQYCSKQISLKFDQRRSMICLLAQQPQINKHIISYGQKFSAGASLTLYIGAVIIFLLFSGVFHLYSVGPNLVVIRNIMTGLFLSAKETAVTTKVSHFWFSQSFVCYLMLTWIDFVFKPWPSVGHFIHFLSAMSHVPNQIESIVLVFTKRIGISVMDLFHN